MTWVGLCKANIPQLIINKINWGTSDHWRDTKFEIIILILMPCTFDLPVKLSRFFNSFSLKPSYDLSEMKTMLTIVMIVRIWCLIIYDSVSRLPPRILQILGTFHFCLGTWIIIFNTKLSTGTRPALTTIFFFSKMIPSHGSSDGSSYLNIIK